MNEMSLSISLLALLKMGARVQLRDILLIGNPQRARFDIRRDDLLFGIYDLTHEGFEQGMKDLVKYARSYPTAGWYCPTSDDHHCRRSDCVGMLCGLQEIVKNK